MPWRSQFPRAFFGLDVSEQRSPENREKKGFQKELFFLLIRSSYTAKENKKAIVLERKKEIDGRLEGY